MDRNNISTNYHVRIRDVALRKESVDRNSKRLCYSLENLRSLSARRAWIEILICFGSLAGPSVALRKESVDRNSTKLVSLKVSITSLSARRAWIEIASSLDDILAGVSRSPQGERG